MTITPALERWRQEYQQFNIMLSWALSSKLVRPYLKRKKKSTPMRWLGGVFFFPSHHSEMIRWCNCFSVATMPPWKDLVMYLFSSCPEGQRRDNRIRQQQLGRLGGHLGVLRHSLPYWTKSTENSGWNRAEPPESAFHPDLAVHREDAELMRTIQQKGEVVFESTIGLLFSIMDPNKSKVN